MNIRPIFLLLVPYLAVAQGTSTGGAFAKIPSHAVTAALGDLSVVSPAVLGAAGMNPANLFSVTEQSAVIFTHASWIQDISGQRVNTSFPLPLGRLALGAATTTVAGVEVREQPGPAIGTFDAKSALLSASWALPVFDGIVGGIAASYLYEKLYLNESTGFGLDVGALAETPVDGLMVGVSLVNLGKLSAFRTEAVDIPATVRIGSRYRIESGEIAFEPAVALRHQLRAGDLGVALGGSATFRQLVGVRFSWRSGETSRSLGLGMNVAYKGLGLEYSLVPMTSGLGTAHVITVLAQF